MRCLISISLLLLLAGCADLGYYWHNASGHLALMDQRVDIEDMLADEGLDPQLRERLLLVREIRRFSVERLALPDNGSYTSYAELDRPYVVQNLFAAPEFSTRLHRWCYPLIGCAAYRGYFDEQRLADYIETMRADGFEVHVGRVSAYSTLGWFDDPVLSSFIDWPDYRLAGLLFHELTHQRIYIDDDTAFNESLASAVQQVGAELWLESRDRAEDLQTMSRWMRYRDEVTTLIESTRERLAQIYRREISDAAKRELKSAEFERARARHIEVAANYDISGGFTRWFDGELNNAKIGSVSAYNTEIPAFVNMIRAFRGDFDAFFDYAEQLGELDRGSRGACLDAWRLGPSWRHELCPATSFIAS